MELLTAGAIATLAFTKFFDKAIEKFAEATLAKMDELRQKIWQKLRGKPQLEAALQDAENGSQEKLETIVAPHLEEAMNTDKQFAQEVQTLAQEIQQEINIGEIQGRNVQNVYGGEAFQSNDANAPTFQGGSGHNVTINYNQK